jgi:hypothetical protein
MQQEKKYGKCPECGAPCEVIDKVDTQHFEGDTFEIPYVEHKYQQPVTPIWVKAKPVNNGFYPVQYAGGGYGGCGFKDGEWNQSLTDSKIIAYLDESPSKEGNKDRKEDNKLIEFIRDCAENWDCDPDSHTYNLPCRKCEATKLYEQFKNRNNVNAVD